MTRISKNFLNNKFGYTYEDLYDPLRLKDLTQDFYGFFESADKINFDKFAEYRDSSGQGFDNIRISNILINSSRYLNNFLIDLFQLDSGQKSLIEKTEYENVLSEFKSHLQKKVFRKFKSIDPIDLNWAELNEFAGALKRIAFPDLDFVKDEEVATALMFLELREIEKEYRWFHEGDKFAPVDFVISEAVIMKTNGILGEVRTSGILKNIFDTADVTDLNLLKFIHDELEKWIYAKKFYDAKAKKWVLFSEPQKIDFARLVDYEQPDSDFPEMIQNSSEKIRRRFGFKLTDNRMDTRQILNEVNYCIFCHDRDKDSCSKGIKDSLGKEKKNPLGIELEGCPLNEKISEMHYVRKEGLAIAALALIIIDNPNVPGTGHRICNDCMKSCIFQAQDPVNIPQTETSVLTDVFKLPYGYEIYSLLTRWNPLNVKRPYSLPYNGKNIMVVGMGPAGYTLSHFLLNEGFGVAGIDALKIESVHKNYCGEKDEKGFTKFPEPVKYFNEEIAEELDQRVLQGFGGVSEYGITVRWDKNFLTAIYINLSRRDKFRMYDGVRFGGTLTIEDIWKLGFDHIAVATGAGKPTIINMKNNLIRGIKKASDFLMALQLTGAAKENNLANLQIHLPAVVIGGGLTAIDTATELLAYYPVQVLKVLDKYEKLVVESGEEIFWSLYDDEEKEIMKTFIEHGRIIRKEVELAEKQNRRPDLISLEREWGGVTIAYRKRLIDSPAYRLNHEEIIKALEEGIRFTERLVPAQAISNKYGAVDEIIFERQHSDIKQEDKRFTPGVETIRMKAKTVMVAAGTSPNIIYEKEYPGTFELDERKYFFKPYKLSDSRLVAADNSETGFFTSYNQNGKYITYYGDNHPKYAGNVVKAMASAKDGYEKIIKIFEKDIAELKFDESSVKKREDSFSSLVTKLDNGLIAVVEEVIRLTPSIVEVIIRAPFAVEKFCPGQFYRLQNYETASDTINDTVLTMEGLAMTGSLTDNEKGLLSIIVLEMGVSSRLVANLKKGERVIVMGPTGTPTHIPKDEKVLLVGGGLGNAVLFSIANALKSNNNKVVYFAGYKNSGDVYKMGEVEVSADQVIWSNDTGKQIIPRREQDLTFTGNIVQAMEAYNRGMIGKKTLDFKQVDRIITIGSDRMMNAVKLARHTIFKNQLKEHVAIGSINSSMQCMMKEICAQCLQRHVDPVTKEESFVFSCFNQDQSLDNVDFNNLNQRLRTNSVLEKLTNIYLTYLLSKNERSDNETEILEKSKSQ